MRVSVFTGEVALKVLRPLQPVWIGAVAISLIVIAWAFSHSFPGALAGCLLLVGAIGGHAREGRLRAIHLSSHDLWSGENDVMAVQEMTATRQVVLRDVIVLGFRTIEGASPADVALTKASTGDAAFRRLAVRLRFASMNGVAR
jgi:hypothetical protein